MSGSSVRPSFLSELLLTLEALKEQDGDQGRGRTWKGEQLRPRGLGLDEIDFPDRS